MRPWALSVGDREWPLFRAPMGAFKAGRTPNRGSTLYCTNVSMERVVYFAPLWCQMGMLKQTATTKRKSPHSPMMIGNTNVIPIGDCPLLLRKAY